MTNELEPKTEQIVSGTTKLSRDKKLPTGIDGLDKMLDGGLRPGRLVIVSGGPGTGKSVLAATYLHAGATAFGEPGVLVLLEEDASSFRDDMSRIGLDVEALEKNRKLVIMDLSMITSMDPREFMRVMFTSYMADETILDDIGGELKNKLKGDGFRQFTTASIVEPIKRKVKEINAKRLVIDGLSSLVIREPNIATRRQETALLFRSLRETGCTILVTHEGSGESMDSFATENYLAQGVILMANVIKADKVQNSIRIIKLRGVNHDKQPHPFVIEETGLKVYHSEAVL